MTALPTRDADGSWATPETWECKREQCECRSQDAITIRLTDKEDVE